MASSKKPASRKPGTKKSQAPTRLLLVRHAVTEETGKTLSGQTRGIDLSEEGKAQAKALGERLTTLPVAAVYASPLERTRQTADPIADAHGLEVRELPDVIDYDVGEWTGKPLSELAKGDLWRVIQAAPSRVVFPGGEALAGMQARVVAGLDRVVAEHAGRLVVVSTHADVVKAAVAHYIGLHFDLFQRLVVAPASVTALAFSGPFASLVLFNDTGALDGLAPTPQDPMSDGSKGQQMSKRRKS